jgi:hypothetical protein
MIWPFSYFYRRRIAKARQQAIDKEEVVTDINKAKWIVYQADGKIRYVANHLFARDCDFAQLIEHK